MPVSAILSSLLTDVSTLLSRLSSARAGYLDNLSGGAVALASAVAALPTSVIQSVQYVSINLTSATSATATITAVNTAKAVAHWNGATASHDPVAGNSKTQTRLELTNSTTITAYRSASDSENVYVRGVIVEFK